MPDFLLPLYDKPRAFINNCVPAKLDSLKGERLKTFLIDKHDYEEWPKMNEEEWNALVKFVLEEKVSEQPIDESIWAFGKEQDNGIASIPTNKKSSWQCYRNYLLNEKDFSEEVVDEIERAAFRILRRLRGNLNDGPGKGMVVGNVQSGKTANMAAVMAMAADWDFKFFVILSGTIESLRLQTKERLWTDLNRANCNLSWHIVEKPIPNNSDETQQLKSLAINNINRYFTVSLKNSSRLKDLISWLQECPDVQKNLKVLVIDDEADQAGINAADISQDESTTINQLIKNLVHGKTPKSGLKKKKEGEYKVTASKGQFGALNYIGYTATPYANVLNEAGTGSLYPSDFLTILKGSKEYFGPQQIFGNSQAGYTGLDIVREITEDEVAQINDIHRDKSNKLPDSLKDAVRWFLCCVACRRFWKDRTPVTLLIHTNHKTAAHNTVADLVGIWIADRDTSTLTEECLKLWKQETRRFTKDDLLRDYPDYDGNQDLIRELPATEELRPLIQELLNYMITHIPINEEGGLEYHRGIHLCIDNSGNNGIQDGQVSRLIYPKGQNIPDFAPAFIVVGGQTLSRGLTLEGLVSTYFLRTTRTCDALMQMGRWFGYRKGYELLPRIWMSAITKERFEFLSDMDQDLREEIHRMAALGISPSEAGPRIMNTPDRKFINIVALNKQQLAVETDFNFSGMHKETTTLDINEDTLENNKEVTYALLDRLGNPEANKECNSHSRNAKIWRNVSNEDIMQFLGAFKFSPRQRFFNDLSPFMEWIREMYKDNNFYGWNVVLAGIETDRNGVWAHNNVSVNMVSRTPLINRSTDDSVNIQHLLDPNDMLADVDVDNNEELKKLVEDVQDNHKAELARMVRDKSGLATTPRLIIYPISKGSKSTSDKRRDMNTPIDPIGIDILIPGIKDRTSNSMKLTIKLDPDINSNIPEDEY